MHANRSRTIALMLVTLSVAVALAPAPTSAATGDARAFESPSAHALALEVGAPDPARALRNEVCASVGSTAALPCEAWSAKYCATTCYDIAYLVDVSPDGKRIFTAGSGRVGTGDEFLTVAYDEQGRRLWAKGSAGDGLAYNFPTALAASPDGSRVFVTGFVDESLCCVKGAFATIAYDAADGRPLWVTRYGSGAGVSVPRSLAVSPDGRSVFVTGRSDLGPPTDDDFATVAYDTATGASLWTSRWNGETGSRFARGDYDGASGVAVAPDGSRVFVTGWTVGASTGLDSMTIAYDARTGGEAWRRRIAVGTSDESTSEIRVSPDGAHVFVAGGTQMSGTYDFLVASLGSGNGDLAWLSPYAFAGPGADDDVLYSLDVAPDGSRVFATGPSWTADRYQYATVAWDAGTGRTEWAARYAGPGGGDSRSMSVRASPDSTHVYVTGFSGGWSLYADAYDVATLAYDATSGALTHTWRFDGSTRGRDMGFALAPSPDAKRVYAVGTSAGSNGFLYTTLAYDT